MGLTGYTTHGGISFLDGFRGDYDLAFDGNGAYIQHSTALSCMTKPYNCANMGLTFKLHVKFTSLVENMVIFSSGGERADEQGIIMFYRRQRICVTLSTKLLEWSACQRFNRVGAFVSFEFSWARSSGLEMFADGVLLARSNKVLIRTIKGTSIDVLRIGGPRLGNRPFCGMVFGGWQVIQANRRVIDAIGYIAGNYFLKYCYFYVFIFVFISNL